MAVIAGKVAPRFMGVFNLSTTYQFYDAVTHNNKLYFCKKSGTVGKAPTGATDDNWFLSLDGTFADAASLGGETAEQWQTKLDNIQTTSSAILSTAGWYRVAEYAGFNLSALKGGAYANLCELVFKRRFNNTDNEVHKLRFTLRTNKITFEPLGSYSNNHILTKVRYTYNEAELKGYIEVYYNANVYNSCSFILNDVWHAEGTWKALDPVVLTSETVDGVTVVTTYDIPANASPVTDLDLDLRTLPQIMPSGTDVRSCTENGVYYFDGYATNYVNMPSDTCHNAILFVTNATKASGTRITHTLFSINENAIYTETTTGGNFWTGWSSKYAKMYDLTTALANYLPLSGGTLTSSHSNMVLNIISALTTGAYIRFSDGNNVACFLGVNREGKPAYSNGNAEYDILHTGNSAKVAIQSTAPTDTTSLWVDTANKVTKAYIDGAWTQVA